MSGFSLPRIPPVVSLLAVLACSAAGQTRPESPVFRSYKSAEERRPLIRPSDPLAELWRTFILARRAEAGDALAAHELGIRYFVGLGAVPDTMLAAYWIGRGSAGGVIRARFHLAILAYHGWGVEWNTFEAFRLAASAAEQDLADAQYMMSFLYLEDLIVPSDLPAARKWAEKAVAGGHRPARDLLKRIEEFSREAAADTAAVAGKNLLPVFLEFATDTAAPSGSAAGLVRSLAEGAGPELRQALGLTRYLDSTVVSDSSALARVVSAAEAGSPEALTLLGRWHEKGTVVARDRVTACAYYARAIRMDSPRAPRMLLRLLDEAGTTKLIRERAGSGDPEARYVWAALLGVGMDDPLVRSGAPLVPAQGLEFLRSAAGGGYLPAAVELGLCFFSGRWVPADPVRAYGLWEEAARRGSREASIRLAVLHVQGRSDSMLTAHAVRDLEYAAEEGSVLAEFALGYCRERGIAGPERLAEAVRLYRAAARRGSQDSFRALRRLHDARRPDDPVFRLSG